MKNNGQKKRKKIYDETKRIKGIENMKKRQKQANKFLTKKRQKYYKFVIFHYISQSQAPLVMF